MDFALPWSPGGVADAELEEVGVILEEFAYQSSLHPFTFTFPTPEHPLSTSGRNLGVSLE